MTARGLQSLDFAERHHLFVYTLSRRDAKGAMRQLQAILEDRPDLTGKYCGALASVLYQLGELQTAARLYRDAIEFDADDLISRLHLGIVLVRLGCLEEANECWAYLEEHHPDSPYTHLRATLSSVLEGDFGEAKKSAERVLALVDEKHPLWLETHKIMAAMRQDAHDNAST